MQVAIVSKMANDQQLTEDTEIWKYDDASLPQNWICSSNYSFMKIGLLGTILETPKLTIEFILAS